MRVGGGDRGDLSGHRQAVEIAWRPLCNKRQKFKPVSFCLVENDISALVLIIETLEVFHCDPLFSGTFEKLDIHANKKLKQRQSEGNN